MAILQIRSGLSTTPTFRTSSGSAFKPPQHLFHLPTQQHLSSLGLAAGGVWRKTGTVVRRAGPSSSSYILALALPLSLLIFTVFTSIRIADKLDSDYMEELELNQAIMEAEGIVEYYDDGTDVEEEELQQLPLPGPGDRIRKRPKRQVSDSDLLN